MSQTCWPTGSFTPISVADAVQSDPVDSAAGVLDRLMVPAAPLVNAGDGRSGFQPLTADPIAVPTPTAGEFGLAVALGLVIVQLVWRARRPSRRRPS